MTPSDLQLLEEIAADMEREAKELRTAVIATPAKGGKRLKIV